MAPTAWLIRVYRNSVTHTSRRDLKHLLVLAYYFPPMGMSGVQRVSKFVKYLPDNGWRVTVVTPTPAGYFAYDESLLSDVRREGVRIRVEEAPASPYGASRAPRRQTAGRAAPALR